MKYQDYYELLGVSRSASEKDIQKAYRKLARKYHPDVNKEKGAEDRFKKINEANEVLSDPEKRKRYDALGENWKSGQDFRPPPGWEGGSFNSAAAGSQFDFGAGFSDFFEAFFGGSTGQFSSGFHFGSDDSAERFEGARRHTPQRASPSQEAELPLTVEELYVGGKKSISLESIVPEGNTSKRTVKNYEVSIPPGTTLGSKIRLAGQAISHRPEGSGGDILLKVIAVPHPRFRIEGFDIYTTLRVSPSEAALGAKVPVVTVAGEALVSVPAGMQSGKKLRLVGKGLIKKDRSRGDLYAEVAIAVPLHLNAQERELYEQLANASNFNPRRD